MGLVESHHVVKSEHRYRLGSHRISVGVARWMDRERDLPFIFLMSLFTLGKGMDYVNICNSLNVYVRLAEFSCDELSHGYTLQHDGLHVRVLYQFEN